MAFPNTHTPTRAEITGKARYQCPMHKVHGADAYYLTPEMEKHFRRLYPVTMNRDMMRLFGISFSTVQRFKRSLGLEKKMKTIRRKHAKGRNVRRDGIRWTGCVNTAITSITASCERGPKHERN